jgi:hypothetical protein
MDINKIMELANNFNIVELGAMLAGRDELMLVHKMGDDMWASKGVPQTVSHYETVRYGELQNFTTGSDLHETFVADGQCWQVIAKALFRGNAEMPSKLVFVALATDKDDSLDLVAVKKIEETAELLFSHPFAQAEFVRKAIAIAHEMRERRKEMNRQFRYQNWQEV